MQTYDIVQYINHRVQQLLGTKALTRKSNKYTGLLKTATSVFFVFFNSIMIFMQKLQCDIKMRSEQLPSHKLCSYHFYDWN